MNPRPPADLQIPFDRVTWRDGQLLASRDLQDDGRANQRRRGLHTRYLHDTWGIALGFTISASTGGTSIRVGPGYAIDGTARDILMAESLDLPVPNTRARVDLVLVMTYQEDRAYRALPDIAAVCGSGGLNPRGERPVFGWRTLETLSLGAEVPLARVSVQQGALVAPPDLTIRRNAKRLLRPHIGFGTVPADAHRGEIFGEIRVDTSDAGFSRTPQYFARLNPGGKVPELIVAYIGALAFIDRAAPDSFYLNVLLLTEKISSFTVTWLGVEPVTGCEPLPNLLFYYTLAGFMNMAAPVFQSGSFISMEVPR